MVFLASDNTSGVHPAVMQALQDAAGGHAFSYGADAFTEKLNAAFRRLFECETLLAFPVFNGSAANCLALAAMMRPFEAVICHDRSHIESNECGMPEFFTGGKTISVGGKRGKLNPEYVAERIKISLCSDVHHSRPKVISVTQATESGTLYSVEEIKRLSDIACEYGMLMHMDGSRFANAVAALGCAPADLSWKAGISALSFGGAKNGAMLAEAIIFFDHGLAENFNYIRKRAGQLASKQRYIAAQLLALLENGLWLKNATHANAMATLLAKGLAGSGMEIVFPVETNSVFTRMDEATASHLHACGHHFYAWPEAGHNVYRLVTGFSTEPDEISLFLRDAQRR